MAVARRLTPKAILLVIVVAVVAAVATATALFLAQDREETLAHYRVVTAATARFLEEHARRTIQAADLVIGQTMAMIASRGGVDGLDAARDWKDVAELASHLPERGYLWIFDAEGAARLSSRQPEVPKVTAADRGYFRAHRDGGADFHIGPAIRGRTTGAVVFTVSRAIRADDGRLLGVVQVALDVSYFTSLYDLLDQDLDPLMGVYRLDGQILIRRPGLEAFVGRDVSDAPVFALARSGERAGTYELESPLDGITRILSYRTVSGLPLLVVAGIDRTLVLNVWQGRVGRTVAVGAAALAVLVVLGWIGWTALARDERGRQALAGALTDAHASERRANAAAQEMRRARMEAVQAGTRLQEAIECLPDGFVLFDADDRLVTCNSRYRELFPLIADRLVPGARFEDLLRRSAIRGQDVDVDAWVAGRLALHRPASRTHEQHLGGGRWLRIEERPTTDGGHVGVRIDISEAKRREAELAALVQRNTLLVAAVEASPNAVVVTDATTPEPEILYVNPAFEALTGYPAAEVMGRSVRLLYGPDTDRIEAGALQAAKLDDSTVTAELLNYRKDGSTFRDRIRLAPVKDEAGRTVAHVAVLWDVTAERHREAEERQRQKLESLGQLAGGIAHEINNLLQPVVSLASLNLRHPAAAEDLRADLSDILESARQCREVVGAVLAFARREGTATAPLCLDEAVRAALGFIRCALPPSIQVEDDITVTGAVALVGRTELIQVLTNLLTNAADAMNGHGTATVTLAADGGPDAPAWRLTVRDTGCGMDEAVRQRIFEPFYTTKDPGAGTGLGLSVVHGIVRSWSGSIVVESVKEQGTMIAISIPAASPPSREGASFP